jgi:hypothetical protein
VVAHITKVALFQALLLDGLAILRAVHVAAARNNVPLPKSEKRMKAKSIDVNRGASK